MLDKSLFYVNGAWVEPLSGERLDVINPADETAVARIALAGTDDVDRAVAAARAAFPKFAATPLAERIEMLEALVAAYERRSDEIAAAISLEMGAPISMAKSAQAASGADNMRSAIKALKEYTFEEVLQPSGDWVWREPIGVCGLITPWNWPMNQISLKVAPALGVGCTVVLKPSEIAPLSGYIFAELVDEVGLPAGVFNLINGNGPDCGVAMSRHDDIDMMSFTGSTRAGISVAQESAPTIKRVAQELGGKSPNIILDDADVERAVRIGVLHCMNNTGQSCNAPTRMLVQERIYDEAVEVAEKTLEKVKVGAPSEEGRHIGPLGSEVQFNKVQDLIQKGIDEGARLVGGGVGRPEGFNRGYYCKPTIFADVTNDMTIAREEIFGPVLSILKVGDDEAALAVANDTPYGLDSYVSGTDPQRLMRMARGLRAGNVHVNGKSLSGDAPFGGYKQSGNGRESGAFGIEDFVEIKGVTPF